MEDEIRYIQELLRDLSYYDDSVERIVPDGIFGAGTQDSVKSFQRTRSLRETGQVDNDTWDKIVEEHRQLYAKNQKQLCVQIIDDIALPIEVGAEELSLIVIQAMMLSLSRIFENVPPVVVNGVYDKATGEAVLALKRLSGLEGGQAMDREFINALSELYTAYAVRKGARG